MEFLLGSFLFFFLLVFGIGVFGTIFWIWMLIDLIQRVFKDPIEKIVWLLIILFTHFIGALIYFIIIRSKNPKGVSQKFK